MALNKISIKAVIFDMDGVITNTMPYHYQAWKQVLCDFGINVTHLDIYAREGQPGTRCLVELFEKYGHDYCENTAQALLAKKEKLFKEIVKERYIVGARTFLKKLHCANIRLALVTGTARHEMLKILPIKLQDLFEVVITGNDVKYGKPHPEPYQKAIAKLKVSAESAVVIENAPFGVQSALGAGLRCFALETSLPAQYLNEATKIFKSIKHMNNDIRFNLCTK
ncbi:MAG: beta-phosphoglucomutase [Lysobacterales bacterium]|jgi:beta-phosphoglucomutase